MGESIIALLGSLFAAAICWAIGTTYLNTEEILEILKKDKK